MEVLCSYCVTCPSGEVENGKSESGKEQAAGSVGTAVDEKDDDATAEIDDENKEQEEKESEKEDKGKEDSVDGGSKDVDGNEDGCTGDEQQSNDKGMEDWC